MFQKNIKFYVTYMIKKSNEKIELRNEILAFELRSGLSYRNQILIELSIKNRVHIDDITIQSFYELEEESETVASF